MLTIGEFSRLCRISARMLRHYDAIGLLRPAHVGPENGYRYYDESQLNDLIRITALKRYGFSLAEVSDLVELSREELAQRLHERRLGAYRELHTLRKAIRLMEEDMTDMETTTMPTEKYSIIVMQTPPQRVFSIRKTICIGAVRELFDELLAEMQKRGLTRAGAMQQLYRGEEFSYENMDVEAQVQVVGEHPDVQELPSQLCAVTTHMGPYESINRAYDAICAWLAEHKEYEVCGAPMERYLKDDKSVSDPEEMETGLLFPVRRKA